MRATEKNRLSAPLLAAVLVVSIGMIGCTNSKDMQSLKAQVSSASADAQAAKAEAHSAKAEAAEAKALARKAMGAADDAKATSAATETKIDRMFKKAMHK